MISRFRLLDGLPPYGPMATPFPPEWGRLGREGLVVEFDSAGGPWVANFRPGLKGLKVVCPHPNGHDAVVIASGDLWVIDPESRAAHRLLSCIEMALEVCNPDGWVFNISGVALVRFGPEGVIWQTRRLSFDGFEQLKIEGGRVTGLAWSPVDDKWHPFRVDLRTGRASGGTYPQSDPDAREKLFFR